VGPDRPRAESIPTYQDMQTELKPSNGVIDVAKKNQVPEFLSKVRIRRAAVRIISRGVPYSGPGLKDAIASDLSLTEDHRRLRDPGRASSTPIFNDAVDGVQTVFTKIRYPHEPKWREAQK
jgi:hypothetical protein